MKLTHAGCSRFPSKGRAASALVLFALIGCEGRAEPQLSASSPGGDRPGSRALALSLPNRDPGRPPLDLQRIGYDQGDPDAPVKVIEVSDFGCGYCRIFNQQSFPVLLEEYIETGKVEWKFVPFVLGMFPNGDKAALAGECAGAQGPGAFLRMRGRLFSDQSGWRDSQDPQAFFMGLARDEGLDESEFGRCLEEESRAAEVEANVRLGKALGARGTPMFVIGGVPVSGALPLDDFRRILDFILEERSSPSRNWLPGAPTGGGPSITALARNLGIGHSVGTPDAPVKILEFSDFGCGYCRLFQEQTRPILLDEYVDSGLVQWTYVPFVLGIFPNGEEAALAGECAAEQEHFEPMRRRLYEDQAGWRDSSEPGAFFARLASEEGLDEGRFTECMEGDAVRAQVQENTRLGQMGGVRGTPAFFINGFPVPGALPIDSFRDLLDLQITAVAAQN